MYKQIQIKRMKIKTFLTLLFCIKINAFQSIITNNTLKSIKYGIMQKYVKYIQNFEVC